MIGLSVVANAYAQPNTSAKPTEESRDINSTHAILISKYMILSGEEALLITNADEINRLVRLFRNNRTVPHACAYHWNLWFRQSITKAVPFSHNEDCEIYLTQSKQVNSLLRTYFYTIKRKPTHFISNLRVQASIEPVEAARSLEDAHHKVFFFRGDEQRLPYIKVQATSISKLPKSRQEWNRANIRNLEIAKNRLREAIQHFQSKYEVVRTTRLDNRYSRFGQEIEHRVEATIYFSYGSNIERIDVPRGIETLERRTPSHYILQLVSEERFSDDFKKRIMTGHRFVLDVFPFPNTQ
ncbi:MAG TPA: hypothetical protein VFZ40_21775 [Pyrinomonadaceae bacterium]